ncbi:MAG: hypothetical protein NC401_19755, partial [Ruminococcus sp.]|nr:hypothetical protein [Ruminococcus sp.]
YEEYLNGRKAQMQEAIFKISATKRTNQFYNVYDVIRSVATRFRLRRLGLNDGRNYGSGQTMDYITKVIEEMTERGLLVSMEKHDTKYIRALNKTEQRQKFKKLLYA